MKEGKEGKKIEIANQAGQCAQRSRERDRPRDIEKGTGTVGEKRDMHTEGERL